MGYVAPVVTGALVTPQADYLHTMLISNVQGASRVLVPTWSVAGGQDDITWYEAESRGNGVWSAKIDAFRHGGGALCSHVYADDECVFGLTFETSSVPAEETGFTDAVGAVAPDFTSERISDEVLSRIRGGSYPAGCPVPLSDLRYLTVRYTGFDGTGKTGEMIVNKKIAKDVVEIFHELYLARYPIERVALIDE